MWFEFYFLTNGKITTDGNWIQIYGAEERILTPQEWAQKTYYFWFSTLGLIDFKFLKSIKLKFLNEVLYEDANFGIMLFMQAQRIFRLPKMLYCYRIREQSTMRPTTIQMPPAYLQSIYLSFNKNITYLNTYNRARSLFLLTLQIVDFFNSLPQNEPTKIAKQSFLPYYLKQSFYIFDFYNDPLELQKQFYKLLPYMDYIKPSFYQKLVIHCPISLYPLLTKFRAAYLWQRDFERKFRRWWKSILKCKKRLKSYSNFE
ncbi:MULTISPECIES: hypothetical protein [unclassified Helicobacter]|uniref:hypothetical protein n=1 Tax=unclassified Helicobacter TaxID=2593540 RepID=UPI0011C01B1B|nr:MULTISPECIES: hypothetical protein [unclassified Helicobacter]